MPSSYAHYRFGGEMISRLPDGVRAAAQACRGVYDLGTHGPDVFFFYRPLANTPVGSVGKRVHFSPAKPLFEAAARHLRLKPRPEGTAYLYGLLTHYALDSVCHPYVKQAQDAGLARHIAMETEFDRLLLEMDGRLLPKPCFPTGHLRLTPEQSRVVAEFYPEVTHRQMREAAFSMGVLTRQCMQKPGMKARVMKKALGSKFSQFILSPECDPRCAVTNEKLLALYGKAQGRFDTLCEALSRHMRTGAPLGEAFAPAFDLA